MTSAALPQRLVRWRRLFGSIEFTLVCLGLAMILVFFGTLAQVTMGTFGAQRVFFNSWWLYFDALGIRIPIFPGGLSLGLLWAVNLIAAFFQRYRLEWRYAGIWMSHFGLLLLLLGQGLTQTLARESQMAIPVGETRNYSESLYDFELALLRTLDDTNDRVVSIPRSVFEGRRKLTLPEEPVQIQVRRYLPNARLRMATADGASMATQGVGTRVSVQPAPVAASDDEQNNPSAFVEVFDGPKSLGIWLVSLGLGAPQAFTVQGKEYRLVLRPRRVVYPYSVTLKEFRHDRYPGTDIPKNFASLVHLDHPAKNERRDTLIYMNHPLRYEGSTFYQASFGEGDRLSILQVVQNPVWLTPYFSCALVLLGLGVQFGMRLRGFMGKKG
jgi:hypothetical protein